MSWHEHGCFCRSTDREQKNNKNWLSSPEKDREMIVLKRQVGNKKWRKQKGTEGRAENVMLYGVSVANNAAGEKARRSTTVIQ